MHNINLGQAKRESECSYRNWERVLSVVSNDKGIENRRLTGLIRFVLNVLQEAESWWCTVGSWMQWRQAQDDKNSHMTDTDPEGRNIDHVDKKVDIPG